MYGTPRRIAIAALGAASILGPSAGVVQAGPVTGTNVGVFVNPTPGATVTGVGTSHFTSGRGDAQTGPSSLTYAAANPISSTTETPFRLGTLTYYNGTTTAGTDADSVDLRITLTLTQPAAVVQAFAFTLDLVTTPNSGTADQNADYLYFPTGFSSATFSAGGDTYTLRILGFSNVVGDGFLQSDGASLHVREGRSATADLMAVVTTNLRSTPEPSAWIPLTLATSLGALTLRRRLRAAG